MFATSPSALRGLLCAALALTSGCAATGPSVAPTWDRVELCVVEAACSPGASVLACLRDADEARVDAAARQKRTTCLRAAHGDCAALRHCLGEGPVPPTRARCLADLGDTGDLPRSGPGGTFTPADAAAWVDRNRELWACQDRFIRAEREHGVLMRRRVEREGQRCLEGAVAAALHALEAVDPGGASGLRPYALRVAESLRATPLPDVDWCARHLPRSIIACAAGARDARALITCLRAPLEATPVAGAATLDPCAAEAACTQQGRCTTTPSGCAAARDVDCRASFGCYRHGLCAERGGACVVPDDVDPSQPCADRRACKVAGFCSGTVGRCEAAHDGDCAAAYACTRGGWCEAADGECQPGAVRDELCRTDPAADLPSPCGSDGRCVARAGVCVAGDDDGCRASDACKLAGECTAVDGRCRATSDRDCERSTGCEVRGLCRAVGGECRVGAATDAACSVGVGEDQELPSPCAAGGACTAAGSGSCYPTRAEDCEVSEGCVQWGACGLAARHCAPRSAADCRASRGCEQRGRCSLVDGQCAAASEADCEGSTGCRDHGQCKRDAAGHCRALDCATAQSCRREARCSDGGWWCAYEPALGACRASDLCRAEGRCHDGPSECEAASERDCRASTACRDEARCVLDETWKSCVATEKSGCGRTPACRDEGRCGVPEGGSECAARDDRDCENARACREEGRCVARDGHCAHPPAPVLPGPPTRCEASEACAIFGRCGEPIRAGTGDEPPAQRCVARTQADCDQASQCEAWGGCTFDGQSCRLEAAAGGDERVELVDAGADPREPLRYALGDAGPWRQVVRSQTHMRSVDPGGEDRHELPTTKITLTVAAHPRASGGWLVAGVVDELTAHGGFSFLHRQLRSIIGTRTRGVLTPAGEWLASNVIEGKQLDEAARQMLGAIQEGTKRAAMAWPERPVGVGARWRVRVPASFAHVRLTGEYLVTLAGRTPEGELELHITSRVDGAPQGVTATRSERAELARASGHGVGVARLHLEEPIVRAGWSEADIGIDVEVDRLEFLPVPAEFEGEPPQVRRFKTLFMATRQRIDLLGWRIASGAAQGGGAIEATRRLLRVARGDEPGDIGRAVDTAFLAWAEATPGGWMGEDLGELARVLSMVPGDCAPHLSQDGGGTSVTRAPPLVDAPGAESRRVEALLSALAEGVEVTARCAGVEVWDEVDEGADGQPVTVTRRQAMERPIFILALARVDGQWKVRGWRALTRRENSPYPGASSPGVRP